MPGQFHKRRWFYGAINRSKFRFVGARYYGLVWGRYWPVLAVVIDDSFYEPALAVSVCLVALEVGVFIDTRKSTADTAG